ncbi:ABC transporter ATP-binding protein [Thermodesulfobacteriota bacterium]
MSIIQIKKISKTYDPGLFKKKVKAVTDLSLTVQEGEVLGLIGPNGAGKSTTIRLVLGLSRPDRGTILFRGKPLSGIEVQRQVGYLPENPYLYDHLTLEELLTFGGRVSGLSRDTIRQRQDDLLSRLVLQGSRKRALRTFSKGMLQRAGLCFALLHDPDVVILDEPMSGLDPIGRKMVFDLVTEMKEQGKTIFFCSHILSDVERLCDRIGLLVGGRLVKVFEKREFVADAGRPVHLVVEGLSRDHESLLCEGGVTLTREEGRLVVSLKPQRLTDIMAQLQECGAVVTGTRSERVSLEQLFLENSGVIST